MSSAPFHSGLDTSPSTSKSLTYAAVKTFVVSTRRVVSRPPAAFGMGRNASPGAQTGTKPLATDFAPAANAVVETMQSIKATFFMINGLPIPAAIRRLRKAGIPA